MFLNFTFPSIHVVIINIRRFVWCNDNKAWTEAKWTSVVFSDECAIELNANRKMFVFRRPGDGLKQKYVQRIIKHPLKLMVWGAIRGDGILSIDLP